MLRPRPNVGCPTVGLADFALNLVEASAADDDQSDLGPCWHDPTACNSQALDRKQPTKKGSVALQGHPKLFGGDIVALAPLAFEAAALIRENLCQPLHGRCDQMVGVLDGASRVIDKVRLDAVPRPFQVLRFGWREQRLSALGGVRVTIASEGPIKGPGFA